MMKEEYAALRRARSLSDTVEYKEDFVKLCELEIYKQRSAIEQDFRTRDYFAGMV
jgi:hypothetical protein